MKSQSASASSSQTAPTDKLARLQAQLDQCGTDLERTLVEFEHIKNSDLAKDDKIKALEDQLKAANDLAALYKNTSDAYEKAASERGKANAIDAEIKALQDQRAALQKGIIDDMTAEIKRLRAQRGFKVKLGGALLFVGIAAGVLATLAVGK